jgi:hypothetical protein
MYWIGDLPSWLASLAATGALIFAAKGASVAKGMFEIERRREEAATKVAAWYAPESTGASARWGAHVKNQSDLPIYDLRVEFHHFRRGHTARPYPPVVVPDSLPVVVPPGEREFIVNGSSEADDHAVDATYQWLVEIQFTDSKGVTWKRNTHGLLNRI